MRVAAIDIGTVTCRLFVADVTESGVRQVVRESMITNLGEGVDAAGHLSEAAIQRTVEQAARYRAAIDRCAQDAPVDKVVALATSASRDADNAADFVERLQAVGVELSVIAGSREAQLSFLGASNGFRGEDLLFCDIGGGSTELVYGRNVGSASDVAGQVDIARAHSFNIGCRRMTERFLTADPPTKSQLSDARAWALELLAPFFADAPRCQRLLAVAGTATSVVAVRDVLVPYDRSLVHGVEVSRDELRCVFERMCALPLEERMQVPGLQPQRALVFPAGMVILDAVMELSGAQSYTACETDILYGIVLDAACS